jgi:hypothetical protein
MHRKWFRSVALVAISALVGAGFATTVAGGSESNASSPPAPLGKAKYLVYLADATLSLSEIVEFRGDLMEREVMKKTPEEIAEFKSQAVSFFRDHYGLDFSAGDSSGSTTLMHVISSPKLNYRAYTVSGERVPASGWEVRDHVWLVAVGPGGTTLHGTWGGSAGRTVPEGTALAFGEYSIAVEKPDGSPGKPIDIHFETIAPVPPMAIGTNPAFACDLTSPDFGRGEAFGAIDIRPRPDGKVHYRVRNVLTFP